MKFLNMIDGADKLITDANNRLVTDTDISNWNNKQDALGYTPVNKAGDTMTGDLKVNGDIVAGKELVVGYNGTTESLQRHKWKYNGSTGYLELWRYSNQNKWELSATFPNRNTGDGGLVVEGKQMATEDYVNNKVKTDVPANAKFTDTTYSEITTSEIDAGTASTLRTITGRRVKYILDKVQGWIGGLTKSDVGLSNVDNVKQATKVEFDEHLADYATESEYGHVRLSDLPKGKKVARFVIGTSTAGWTAADCDYLCDGTADQTEINNAIQALPATGGEIVILDGTYNITAKIDVTKDNVNIRGNGNATILKRMFDSSVKEGVITLTSRSGCKIANLQIEGNKTSYTNSNNYGIYLSYSINNTVTGNTCNNNTSSGIYLISSSSSGNTVTGNACNNNYYGIDLYNSSNNTVTSNTCNNNNYGIYLNSYSINNTVTGNTCNNNRYYGIYLISSSNNNTVTGNTCNNNNRYYGIYLISSSNNTVTGNTCNNNRFGIALGSSSNNTVTGNTCNNNNNYGIDLYNSSNNTVTSNTCNNNNYGIDLNSSSNNTVTGNTCIRGTGLATDYTESQHTIWLRGTSNNYNLIAMNNCMGKAVTNEGGTGNSVWGNKYDSGDDLPI